MSALTAGSLQGRPTPSAVDPWADHDRYPRHSDDGAAMAWAGDAGSDPASRLMVLPPGEVPPGAVVLALVVALPTERPGEQPTEHPGEHPTEHPGATRGPVRRSTGGPGSAHRPMGRRAGERIGERIGDRIGDRAVEQADEPDPARRHAGRYDTSVLTCAPGLVLDRPGRRVLRDGRELILTRREFDLFEHLAVNPGWVFSREQLLASVWATDDVRRGGPRTVDVHVSRLRRKLGNAHSTSLQSLRGVGYRWVGGEAGEPVSAYARR